MTHHDTASPEWNALNDAIRAYFAKESGDLVVAWVLNARVILADDPEASGTNGLWHGDYISCVGLARATSLQLERDLMFPHHSN